MPRCVSCGAALEPGSAFCVECSTPILGGGASFGSGVCTKCGAALEPGSAFCVECGTPI